MASYKNGESKVKYYHSKYITYSRAIAVMWAVLVVSFLIITLVCFIQPAWIGTAMNRPGFGHFGLWNYYDTYYVTTSGTVNQQAYIQHGKFLEFHMIPSDSFRAATVFVGLTVLLMIICVISFLLFCCLSTKVVFLICGVIISICAVLMFLACVIYPGGFDADPVKRVCINSDSYDKGECVIQWAFILAIIGIFDAIVLAVLAFCLAFKQVKLLPSQEKKAEKMYVVEDRPSAYNRETLRSNGAPQVVRPVVIVDGRESIHSQPIGTLRSHKSNSKHNFRL